jgi:hypothetical protein
MAVSAIIKSAVLFGHPPSGAWGNIPCFRPGIG